MPQRLLITGSCRKPSCIGLTFPAKPTDRSSGLEVKQQQGEDTSGVGGLTPLLGKEVAYGLLKGRSCHRCNCVGAAMHDFVSLRDDLGEKKPT